MKVLIILGIMVASFVIGTFLNEKNEKVLVPIIIILWIIDVIIMGHFGLYSR